MMNFNPRAAGNVCPITGQAGACPASAAEKQYKNEEVSASVAALEAHQASQQPATPAIHAVTDNAEAGVKPRDFDREFDQDVPSLKQYKKLKRTTTLITNFYRNGTQLKSNNYESAVEDLARLEVDKQMCQEQLLALDGKPTYKGHLKHKDIKEDLEKELDTFDNQKKILEDWAAKCKGLHEWSQGIVRVCEWLELNLDNYCAKYMTDLPRSVVEAIKPVPELTAEQAEEYSKGLDEIMHNLNESRDFFQAAVDGRLDQYYQVEKQMLEDQLKVLEKYPASNPRRDFIETTVREDLDHAIAQIESGQQEKTKKRRKYMLDLHLDFLKVLTFFQERLKLLNASSGEQRTYDDTFTTTFAFGEEQEGNADIEREIFGEEGQDALTGRFHSGPAGEKQGLEGVKAPYH